jgi:hypothetical protein
MAFSKDFIQNHVYYFETALTNENIVNHALFKFCERQMITGLSGIANKINK